MSDSSSGGRRFGPQQVSGNEAHTLPGSVTLRMRRHDGDQVPCAEFYLLTVRDIAQVPGPYRFFTMMPSWRDLKTSLSEGFLKSPILPLKKVF